MKASELGEGALLLAEDIVERELTADKIEAKGGKRAAAVSYLRSKCKKAAYTMTRSHFASTICLPLTQFRWLVKERGLKDYKLVHVGRHLPQFYQKKTLS